MRIERVELRDYGEGLLEKRGFPRVIFPGWRRIWQSVALRLDLTIQPEQSELRFNQREHTSPASR